MLALEQSHDSKPLSNFEFPKNSVLLVGQEQTVISKYLILFIYNNFKNLLKGVPSHLLALCDAIVEIPQYGQIKSLNAHVATSLILWEWAKQAHTQKNE